MTACALDDSGGDGPALGEGGGVVQVRFLGGEVAGAGVGALAFGGGVAEGGGAAADPGRDLPCLALEDLHRLGGDPFLRVRVSFIEKGPGGFPRVFQDVDEIADHGHADAAAGGLAGDGLDLRAVAVYQGDPLAAVAALRLVEGCGDDGGNVVGDRGGQPLPGGPRPPGTLPLPLVLLASGRGDDV